MNNVNGAADVGRAIQETLHAAGRIPEGGVVEVDYITGVKVRVIHADGQLDEWYDGFIAPGVSAGEATGIADFMLGRARERM